MIVKRLAMRIAGAALESRCLPSARGMEREPVAARCHQTRKCCEASEQPEQLPSTSGEAPSTLRYHLAAQRPYTGSRSLASRAPLSASRLARESYQTGPRFRDECLRHLAFFFLDNHARSFYRMMNVEPPECTRKPNRSAARAVRRPRCGGTRIRNDTAGPFLHAERRRSRYHSSRLAAARAATR